jgi:hypothetical protein
VVLINSKATTLFLLKGKNQFIDEQVVVNSFIFLASPIVTFKEITGE